MKGELLDDDIVLEIRMLRFQGFSFDVILEHIALNHRDADGKPLKLSHMTARRIADGTTYASVGGPRTTRARAKRQRRERALHGAVA
jgi:hypothetical protein